MSSLELLKNHCFCPSSAGVQTQVQTGASIGAHCDQAAQMDLRRSGGSAAGQDLGQRIGIGEILLAQIESTAGKITLGGSFCGLGVRNAA